MAFSGTITGFGNIPGALVKIYFSVVGKHMKIAVQLAVVVVNVQGDQAISHLANEFLEIAAGQIGVTDVKADAEMVWLGGCSCNRCGNSHRRWRVHRFEQRLYQAS